MAHVVVVGAGVVGLATAARLARDGHVVTVLDKERAVAAHQTGRNSGVMHSGLYYAPGSLKATMAVAGQRSMLAYARAHDVAAQVTGKLVVASRPDQVEGLHALAQRAQDNGVPAQLVDQATARQREPHVAGVAALWVESTGIVDYRGVCRALADDIRDAGGTVVLGARLVAARDVATGVEVLVEHEGHRRALRADALVACAGLQADRVAQACQIEPEARIVPFRGEYFELTPAKAALVRGLVYPVPDPRFPFLGVHLTRMVDGGVHVGPNAVLALSREGYTWHDVVVGDVADALGWPGLWRLAARNLVPGAREVVRSVDRTAFARSVAELLPGVRAEDLVPAPAGVRAQALRRDGRLVDDFLVQVSDHQVHVLNAPSPAATCALEIAAHLCERLPV
ncbi:L-2-hydroxyglutarate oxidase [Cellulomonas citrea]|uniref:L-2-hydroxyglutarate oxidase n=1 Tax=Cellulomonas citrea TaxID=1909423 RepID=UPI00135A1F4B|nr:L-2-hydroxyglutarate oxidase [Cellulomonas citrea]